MSSKAAPESLLDELQETLTHGTVARRVEALRRVTDLFVTGGVDYSDEQIGLFDDVFVEIQRKHFVLGQRASAEDAGVTIELLDLRQLGWKQVACGIKEPLQSRLDGLFLG